MLALVWAGCIDKNDAKKMIEALQSSYAQKVQGNVTLRIHIDASGAVRPESTSVVESSGYPALDSAAVTGSRALRFKPAFAKGAPLAISVLFPVYFRHPEAAPLPGDTLLKSRH